MEEQDAGMEEQRQSRRHAGIAVWGAGMEKQDARMEQHECRV